MIFILGSSGFIGSNLVLFYKKKNIEIIGIDIIASSYTNVVFDLREYDKLLELLVLHNPVLVIDCAARTDLNGKNLNDYSSNFKIISNLILAQKTINFKILAFSSMLVNNINEFNYNDLSFYNPTTIYGESKMIYEILLTTSSNNYIIFRPTSIWGPGFKVPYRNFFDLIAKRRFFFIKKPVIKTYCYIENLCLQLDCAINNYPDYVLQKFYFLDGHYNILEWSNSISKGMGKSTIFTTSKIVIKLLGKIGDFLKIIKISFPMTSFRYSNMTNNNIVPFDLSLFNKNNFVNIDEAIKNTIESL